MSAGGTSGDPQIRRLVDAVLLPGFTGTTPPAWLRRAIDDGLGGVVYFARNIADPEQVAELSGALHGLRDGVIIAVDEEGGDVTRLEALEGSSYPGNAALGHLDEPGTTEAVAAAMGRDLRLAGVDVDLAPDADVNTNPDNPVIGTRAFGADAGLVARHSAAFVRGLQGAGVAACAKHFPGHGDTGVDSHLNLPVLDADVATLRRRDLPPFAAAVGAGVRCVMTAHIRFPALDERPATLSPPVLSLLRDELGFDGVLITDALEMHAISRGVGMGRGAVLSLLAGADLLCLGNPDDDEGDYRLVRSALLDAVRDGDLPVHRLQEARARVEDLTRWLADRRGGAVPYAEPGLGLEVARRAVTTAGDVRLPAAPHVLDLRTAVNQAAGRHAPHLLRELARRVPGTTGAAPDGEGTVVSGMLGAAEGRPLVVVVSESHRDGTQGERLAALLRHRPDAVVVCTGWPDPRARLGANSVVTHGAGRVNAVAAAEVLTR